MTPGSVIHGLRAVAGTRRCQNYHVPTAVRINSSRKILKPCSPQNTYIHTCRQSSRQTDGGIDRRTNVRSDWSRGKHLTLNVGINDKGLNTMSTTNTTFVHNREQPSGE